MPVGRPTSYTPELLEKARSYLTKYPDYDHEIPSHSGLAQVLEISRETIYAWNKDKNKKEFSDILEKIMVTQETKLISKGLTGDYNAQIAKLVLGKHGYSEKQETALTASEGISLVLNYGSKAGE